eukprot:499936_1
MYTTSNKHKQSIPNLDHFITLPLIENENNQQSQYLLAMNYTLPTRNGIHIMNTALEHVTNLYELKNIDLIFVEQFNTISLLIQFNNINTCSTAYNKLSQLFKSLFYVQNLSQFHKQWICSNCISYNNYINNQNIFKCSQCNYDTHKKIKYIYNPIHHNNSKQQTIPLIYIHIDSINTKRPLKFGEPLLDALGIYLKHDLIVDIQEIKPKKSAIKTNVIISKHNDNFTKCPQNITIPLLNKLINSVQQHIDNDATKVIFGHSTFSPVRRLKQYILTEQDCWSTNRRENHIHFLTHLPKYCDSYAYPKLATCIILMDCKQNILLTRRHSKLRSFPSCFVVPGGSVDPGETMKDTAKRELFEEVGINIMNVNDDEKCMNELDIHMIAIWESIYPDSKRFDMIDDKTIKYHHIVPIYYVELNEHYSKYKLKLCQVEVDAAVWVNVDVLRCVMDSDEYNEKILHGIQPNGSKIEIKMECLNGIYPNNIGQGIARGHRYGIKKLLDKLSIVTK